MSQLSRFLPPSKQTCTESYTGETIGQTLNKSYEWVSSRGWARAQTKLVLVITTVFIRIMRGECCQTVGCDLRQAGQPVDRLYT